MRKGERERERERQRERETLSCLLTSQRVKIEKFAILNISATQASTEMK